MSDKQSLTLAAKEAFDRPLQLASLTIQEARGLAERLRNIIEANSKRLGNKKYVLVEGWKSIAAEDGCCPAIESIEWVKAEDGRPGGVRARAILKRMRDGMVITSAYGFVGDDEKTWAARPQYAREGMAQTRALSRACRHRYDYVVALMGKEFSTTPAEEVVDSKEVTVLGTVTTAKNFAEGKYAGMTFVKVLPPSLGMSGGEEKTEVVLYTRDAEMGAEVLKLIGKDCQFQVVVGEKMGRIVNWSELEPQEPDLEETPSR